MFLEVAALSASFKLAEKLIGVTSRSYAEFKRFEAFQACAQKGVNLECLWSIRVGEALYFTDRPELAPVLAAYAAAWMAQVQACRSEGKSPPPHPTLPPALGAEVLLPKDCPIPATTMEFWCVREGRYRRI